ncbi:MAG: methyl-accepting chemotaxis protein [Leptospiraceae bacterium]|nr:methyl-accepting chemotaxis protein [Leptospiraceae bacterium]MCP5495205.1 methyl-accepting chemotaxis protein [Leptospiraceae bacterium]
MSERDFSIDVLDAKNKFRDYKLFQIFNQFLVGFTTLFRIIARSSTTANRNMKDISLFSENLRVEANNIHSITREFTSQIEKSSGETHKVSYEIKKIKTQLGQLIYRNNRILDAATMIQKKISDGVENMSNGVYANSELLEQNKELKQSIQELWKKFASISQVTKDLIKISEQTRTLALNAEIEAAHAGEFGKGFSVVAQEMGNYSVKSSEIAHAIVQKIKAVQDDAKLTEINVLSSVEFASEANEQIGKAHSYYMDIKDSIENVTKDSNEFFKSMENLEDSFLQVNQIVARTDKVMETLVLHTKEVLQAISSQLKNIDSINTIVISTFQVSRVLNSLISQFDIPNFKNTSERQKAAEGIIERILNMRGIIINSLYSKDPLFLNILEEEKTKAEQEFSDFIRTKEKELQIQEEKIELNNFFTSWKEYTKINEEILFLLKQKKAQDSKIVYDTKSKVKLKEIINNTIEWLSDE